MKKKKKKSMAKRTLRSYFANKVVFSILEIEIGLFLKYSIFMYFGLTNT